MIVVEKHNCDCGTNVHLNGWLRTPVAKALPAASLHQMGGEARSNARSVRFNLAATEVGHIEGSNEVRNGVVEGLIGELPEELDGEAVHLIGRQLLHRLLY